MREILFRGKRIDNGEWVEGGIYSTNESELPWCGRELIECNVYIITNDDFKKSYCLGWYEGKLKEVIPKTVGQYTGLTDKNGLTKIFEYDIIDANGRKVGNYYENSNLLKDGTCFLVAKMGTKEWSRSEQEAIKRGCKYAE